MATILLMEDDLTVGFELTRDLIMAGHSARMCTSASEAKEELLREEYDLLISDVIVKVDGRAVPDGGIGLVGWVRRTDRVRTLPIIVITGTFRYPGMENILDLARQIGADVGIEKPFKAKELLAKVDVLTRSDKRAS
ncbi:response regulator [uncultured Roseobacter sp.]|uniref:response regulator transcription factor n=2 Tax=uncultured Roseobacter sp. TaxID=114847 RepID=UPI00262F952F|nr:response regulator [uncultured Roseobacter sp.]